MFSVLVLIVCFLSVWLEYNTFPIIIMFVKYLLCTKLNIAEVVYMLKAMALHNHLCCQIIDNFAIFDSSSSFCMKKNKYLFLSLIYNLRRVILEINLICSNSWTHKCLSWLVVILFQIQGEETAFRIWGRFYRQCLPVAASNACPINRLKSCQKQPPYYWIHGWPQPYTQCSKGNRL